MYHNRYVLFINNSFMYDLICGCAFICVCACVCVFVWKKYFLSCVSPLDFRSLLLYFPFHLPLFQFLYLFVCTVRTTQLNRTEHTPFSHIYYISVFSFLVSFLFYHFVVAASSPNSNDTQTHTRTKQTIHNVIHNNNN